MPEIGYADHCAVVPAELTVLTTSKCDAKCAHCLMGSGPDREDVLRLRDAVATVRSAHEARPLRTVVFAGGEPTLLGDDLLEAIAEVHALGVSTRLVTNAGWATSPEAAGRVIRGLRESGLDELNFSADDFHLPFVPLDRVVTAWHAAKGAGFEAVVIALCSGPGSKVTPETMMAALGEAVPLVYDEQGTMNDLPPASADGTVYLISNNFVYRLGRGRTLKEKYLRFADAQALDRHCPFAVSSPAVSAKRHFVACCGIEAENNEVLDLGGLEDAPVTDLIAKANSDPLVLALAMLGPSYLMKRAKELDPSLQFRSRYSAICEICEDVTTNSKAVATLRANAQQIESDLCGPVSLW